MRNLILAVSLCFLSTSAFADGGMLDFQQSSFEEQARQIRADLAEGVTYSEISPDDRHQVVRLLDRIELRLARADSFEDLPDHHRVDVFNDQERINVLLTNASEDSRLECRRERVTGTRRITNVCITVAERRRLRDEGREIMRSQPAPSMY